MSRAPDATRILIAEDDPVSRRALEATLARWGYQVVVTADGDAAWQALADETAPRLAVLDWMMPGLDGVEVCRRVVALDRPIRPYLILLTARGQGDDVVAGLSAGADDYIVKPFSPKELVARVRALLRRLERPEPDETRLVLGEIEVDRARHTVRVRNELVHLTAKEFALLVALIEARGRVLSRQALLEQVWGYSYAEGTRTVDVHVRRLREKLPGLADRLITVKSLGYRLAREAGG